MTDTYELDEENRESLPESSPSVPDNLSNIDGVSFSKNPSKNSIHKKVKKYDDTAEVGKILETVLSAQSAKEREPEPPITVSEESKTPSTPAPLPDNLQGESQIGIPPGPSAPPKEKPSAEFSENRQVSAPPADAPLPRSMMWRSARVLSVRSTW